MSGAPLPGRIDVWCAWLGEVDEALLERYRALVSAPETARMERFHFEEDRRRHLISRALVRTALSRYGALEPREWRLLADVDGRPYADNLPGGLALDFNVSHAAEMVVLAVSSGRVGVDVESLARDSDIERLDRYFSSTERSALLALAGEARRRRFFELWTLKESYVKARGEGLRLPLDAFAFEFRGERGLRLSVEPALADSPGRWRFRQFSPRAGYVVSVCAERAEADASLRVYEAVPLAWERLMAVDVSRSSDEPPPAR